MPRPIGATINQTALHNNISIVKQLAPYANIWSIVKANAYGHGLSRVWKSLTKTDGFALVNIEDAIFLREQGWKKPILLLEGFFQQQDITLIDYYHLTTSIHSSWQIQAIAQAHVSKPINIYLKINTGMNRLGFRPEQTQIIWRILRSLPNIGQMTLMTHFADTKNLKKFNKSLKCIKKAANKLNCLCSLANSATILWHPEAHFDWIRPGIILYGASPSGEWKDINNTNLQPVMTLNSEIIGIQNLVYGDGVGYNYHYHALHSQRIGTVSCGYGDGYPRHAPTGTPVCVDGIRTRTLGLISMDMMAIDLEPCPQASIGSKVELWGKEIKIDEVATSAGTISYELMCSLTSRVPVKMIF
ncbi:catabolic alanine racemase DadX [Pantoea sp. Aalb]|uniref:catabolic alanine racemase DadX n=1 Tax=Pantoea sp. Aalb TaxID=2576762 RepID=UPI00132AA0A1|nr:catabolic alanine racemase DadX [Pantoea sp. Aalb]MXP67380.1 catabolic alanine racemase DadX [Pantoea sp. Aalb]